MLNAVSARFRTDWTMYDTPLGSGLAGVGYFRGDFLPPFSVNYFCTVCGDVWARIEVEGQKWGMHARDCPEHGPAPLFPWQPNYCLEVPVPVLKREVSVIAKLRNPTFYDHVLMFGKE